MSLIGVSQALAVAQVEGTPTWDAPAAPTSNPWEVQSDSGGGKGEYSPVMAADAQPSGGGGSPVAVADEPNADAALHALAASLTNDPFKIYEWVRNNIRTEFYFGGRRGAYLTYLEGAGNDVDQCALLYALFRAAGKLPSYRSGRVAIPRVQSGTNSVGVYEWLRVNYDENAIAILSPHSPATSFVNDSLQVNLFWVVLTVDGTDVKFFPSVKPSRAGQRSNIDTLTGYTLADAVSASGAKTGDLFSSPAIDAIGLKTYLTKIATTASNKIKASDTDCDMDGAELAGYRTIVPEVTSVNAKGRASYPSGIQVVTSTSLSGIPSTYVGKITIRLTLGTETLTWSSPSVTLQGQPLNIEFDGNRQAIVRLGGAAQATSTFAGSGSDVTLTITYAYPTGFTSGNETVDTLTRTIDRSNSVAVLYSFGKTVGRLRKTMRDVATKEVQDVNSVTLSDRLQLIALEYASQECELGSAAAASMGLDYQRGLLLGIVFTRDGFPVLDLQVNRVSYPASSEPSSDARLAGTRSLYLLSGALEGTVMSQNTTGKGFGTPTLIDFAHQKGWLLNKSMYDNVAQVRQFLQNYNNATLGSDGIANIEAFLATGGRVYLFNNSDVIYGPNHYSGYLLIANAGGVSSIIGRASGGVTGSPLNTAVISKNLAASQASSSPKPITQDSDKSHDPVDLATGGFLKSDNDLSLGGSEPLGLNLVRTYNSVRNLDDPVGLGRGWTHSYDLRLSVRSPIDIDSDRAYLDEVLPILVGVRAAQAALQANGHEAWGWMMASSALTWAADQQLDTRAAISMADRIVEFTKRPDGTYASPGSLTAMLSKGSDSSHTLSFRHGNTITFRASDGKFSKLADLFGNILTPTYDGSNRLQTVKDAYNRSLTFSYNGTGRLTSVADSTGRTVSYGRDGTTFTFTDAEGKVEKLEMDDQYRMTKIVDARQRTIVENDYDVFGHVYRQRTFGDATRESQLGILPGVGMEKDPAGGTTWLYFDARARRVFAVDQLEKIASWDYDGADRLIMAVSPKGNVSEFAYDASHVLVYEKDQASNERTIVPDAEHRPWKIRNFEGKETVVTYTAQHRVETITAPGSIISSFKYDAKGRLWKTHAAAYANEKYDVIVYDSFGNIDKITRPDGLTEDYTFNNRGDLLDMTDRSGSKASFEYNKRRQPTKVTQWEGSTALSSQTFYDDAGDVDYVLDASNRKVDLEHDALGHLTQVKQGPISNQIVTLTNSYSDPRTLLTSSTDALNHVTQYDYYETEQLKTITDPLLHPTTIGYDEDYRPVTVKTPLTYTTTDLWEPRSFLDSSTDAEQQAVDYGYDNDGRILTLANRLNKTFKWEYDDDARTIVSKTPLLKARTLVFNTRGLPESIKSPANNKTEFTAYNDEGLPTERTDPVGTTTYTYWPNGLLKSVSEGGHSTYHEYNSANRLTRYDDGEGNTIGYDYYASGELWHIYYPGHKTVEYDYDDFGRLWHVKDWANRKTTYAYDDAGRLIRIEHPNGTYRVQKYYADGRLKQLRDYTSANTLFLYQQFGYDADGRVKTAFKYPVDELFSLNPDTILYDDDNQISTWNNSSVLFDDDGNVKQGPLMSDSLVDYHFNARNQLTAVAGSSYRYNPEGQRVEITGAGAARFLIDPAGTVLIRNKGSATTYYVYGIGLVYEESAGSTKTFHGNQVGSTMALTADDQHVTDSWNYSPYGIVVGRLGNTDTPFQFNGLLGVQADASSLCYMRARYYNPRMMRFLNADPMGFAGGINWYTFCENNPIAYADPTGLWSTVQTWGVVKAVGGGIEFTVGAIAGAGTSWTGVGAVVGGAVATHGADVFLTGVRQAFANRDVDTLTSQGLQAVGISRPAANLVDTGISMVGSGGTGYIRGAGLAGGAARGLEFSHWIPNRWGGPITIWNGNYVPTVVHALSDPYRYRFMPVVWKAANPLPGFLIRQWVRIPQVVKGVAGGVAAGTVGHIEDIIKSRSERSRK